MKTRVVINSVIALLALVFCITEIEGVNLIAAGRMCGKVVCDDSKEAIEYVTVSLYSPSDSSLVAGTVTDMKGNFCFYMLEKGSYYIEVTETEYTAKKIGELKISPDQLKIELGTIGLTPCGKNMKKRSRLSAMKANQDNAHIKYAQNE